MMIFVIHIYILLMFVIDIQEEAKAKGRSLSKQELSFHCEDFRKLDWSDADVVWANSTCFGPELMAYLSKESNKMKQGSFFVTLTQRLTSEQWVQAAPGELMPMSWGSATIYVWKKIAHPSTNDVSGATDEEFAEVIKTTAQAMSTTTITE